MRAVVFVARPADPDDDLRAVDLFAVPEDLEAEPLDFFAVDFFAVDFVPVLLRAVDFFAGVVLRAVVLRAVDFLALLFFAVPVVLRAVDFLALLFFAVPVVLRAVDFFAVDLVPLVLRAVDFLALLFFAVPVDLRAVLEAFFALPEAFFAVLDDFFAVPLDFFAVPVDFLAAPAAFLAVPDAFFAAPDAFLAVPEDFFAVPVVFLALPPDEDELDAAEARRARAPLPVALDTTEVTDETVDLATSAIVSTTLSATSPTASTAPCGASWDRLFPLAMREPLCAFRRDRRGVSAMHLLPGTWVPILSLNGSSKMPDTTARSPSRRVALRPYSNSRRRINDLTHLLQNCFPRFAHPTPRGSDRVARARGPRRAWTRW